MPQPFRAIDGEGVSLRSLNFPESGRERMRAAWVLRKARGPVFSAETIVKIQEGHARLMASRPVVKCEQCFGDFKPKYDRIKKCLKCGKVNLRIKALDALHSKQGYSGYGFTSCKICSAKFRRITSRSCFCSPQCSIVARRAKKNRYQKERHRKLLKTPHYIYTRFLLASIYRMVKNKAKSSIEYVDYTPSEFRAHIESLFKDGMTWENHGDWHIDHIRPLASFRFTNEDGSENLVDLKSAQSLSNLRPLWAYENLSKNKREIA